MFDGFLTFAGDEVINVARTNYYLASGYLPPGVEMNACEDCEVLVDVLNDGKPYTSPLIDKAPWFESSNADTWDFAGIIPLEITGLSGSTRTAASVEFAGDGGTVAATRYASRTVAVTALLVGRTGCSVEAGLTWLSTVLAGSSCRSRDGVICQGDELCALTCCPASVDEIPLTGQFETRDVLTIDPGWRASSGVWASSIGRFTPIEIPSKTLTNQITNPSFEVDAANWRITAGTLARSDFLWPSRVGGWSGLITAGSGLVETVTVTADTSSGRTVTIGAQGSSVATNPTVEAVVATATVNGWQATLGASGGQVAGPGGTVTVGPGTTYPVVAGQIVDWTLNIGTAANPISAQSVLTFLTAADAVVSTFNSTVTEIRADTYGMTKASVNAPVGATKVRVDVKINRTAGEGGGGPVAGTQVYIDAAALYVGATQAGRGFFDGDTTDTKVIDYTWDGVPGASTSTAIPTGTQPELDAPAQPCAEETVFAWNVETISGDVTVVAAARDPETGGFLTRTDGSSGFNAPVTVHGKAPVPYVPDPAWGDWVPVLIVDTAPGANPFTVDPTITQTRYQTSAECLDALTRSYLDVTTMSGPTVVEKIPFMCGEYALKVEWTWNVGNPFQFGAEIPLVTMLSSANGVPEKSAFGIKTDYPGLILADNTPVWATGKPRPSSIECATDPCCSGFIAPPQPPTLIDSCWEHPLYFRRSTVQIPAIYAPGNETGTFIITLHNDGKPKKGLRVRIFPDPLGFGLDAVPVDETSAVCTEFNLTYVPANSEMVIDGVRRQVTTKCPGENPIVSGSSVRGAYGASFEFPALVCNMGYVVAIDIPDHYLSTCTHTYTAGQPEGDLKADIVLRTAIA